MEQHHRLFVDTIRKLNEELAVTRVARVDMIFHFVAQSIDALYESTIGSFRDDAKLVLRHTLYDRLTPAQAVRTVYQKRWPPAFIGRVHLSDVRNALVLNVYKIFGRVLDTTHMPYTTPVGSPDQIEAYRRIAHGRPHMVNPYDTERIVELLRNMHIARLANHLLSGQSPDDAVEVYNSTVGSWLYNVQQNGMTCAVYKLFLDLYAYDHAWDNEEASKSGTASPDSAMKLSNTTTRVQNS